VDLWTVAIEEVVGGGGGNRDGRWHSGAAR
jgi:hypothetical protein